MLSVDQRESRIILQAYKLGKQKLSAASFNYLTQGFTR